jgi:hypothetical protein
MLSNYHHIALARKEMATWSDLHLIECYHKECIDNAPAFWSGPRLVYYSALMGEMNTRGWDKLNYKITTTENGNARIKFRRIDQMEVAALQVNWNFLRQNFLLFNIPIPPEH